LKATLAASGVAPECLARLKAPAGLDLGAITPEEIAVSIIAEIVAARRGKQLQEAGAIQGVGSSGRAYSCVHGLAGASIRIDDKPSEQGPNAIGMMELLTGACAQMSRPRTRPTSHAAIAHPEPVKKPTQNQTPIW
jgi:hypothetical protein